MIPSIIISLRTTAAHRSNSSACIHLAIAAVRTHRITAAVLFCVLAFAIASPASGLRAQSDPLPAGEDVIARYIEATGGAEAYAALNNRVSRGILTFSGSDRKTEVASYRTRPNLTYTIFRTGASRKLEQGCNGEVPWEVSWRSGARILDGDEKERAMREAWFDGLTDWTRFYTKADCTGMADVEGKSCLRVVLTRMDGEPETLYFGRETYLLIKTEAVQTHTVGRITVVVLFSDYRQVDGVLLPHRRVIRFMGHERILTTESVEHNVDIEAGRFKMPAPIRALLLGISGNEEASTSDTESEYRFLSDAEAVECAVLDYAEAVYELKPRLIERSVHPGMTRVGFYRPTTAEDYRSVPMTYDDLLTLTSDADKKRKPQTGGIKDVVVYEVHDKTASARLRAVWGIDFIHLAKIDGRWMIVQILWQNQAEDEQK